MRRETASATDQMRFLRMVTGFSCVTQEIDFGTGVTRYIAAGVPRVSLPPGHVRDKLAIELRVIAPESRGRTLPPLRKVTRRES